jgi:exonuclease SbcC
MIQRLHSLSLTSFRVFADDISIPLDADVVLIYGPNGTGKTSLLCGLELGITGDVNHLAKYSDDYPRCLRHVHAKGDVTATLEFLDETRAARKQTATVNGEVQFVAGLGDMLPPTYRRHFIERCYLSQSRLGRLLEIYQATTPDEPEQPLVRFVRELLGLDPLENLTTGLYQIADWRRVEKASDGYRLLTREEFDVSTRIAGASLELETTRAAFNEWKEKATRPRRGDSSEAAETAWTAGTIRERRTALEAMLSKERAEGPLQSLQRLKGRLDHAMGALRSAPAAGIDESLKIAESKLKMLQDRRAQAEYVLRPAFERCCETLAEIKIPVPDWPARLSLQDRMQELESIVARATARVSEESKAISQVGQELHVAEQSVIALGKELAATALSSATPTNRQRQMIQILGEVLSYIDDNQCPVCQRDYSEVGSGDLRSHVATELSRLGADVQREEAAARRRSEIEAELSAINTRAATLREMANHRVAPTLHQRPEQNRLLNVRREIQQVHNLRHPRPRHVPQL